MQIDVQSKPNVAGGEVEAKLAPDQRSAGNGDATEVLNRSQTARRSRLIFL